MKLWSGRFDKNPHELVEELNASITFDKRLYREDIQGSMAHANMLGKTGIIEQAEAALIIKTLAEIEEDITAGKVQFGIDTEDIHMSVETELTKRIGETGKRLHTARSRNDQVALDIRLHLKREIDTMTQQCLHLLEVLCNLASQHTDTIMPAYTHLQRAQPTTFAHYLMAYANMLRRDVTRLSDCKARMDEMPLGSGALCATTYPINREMVRAELGFARITENSLDAVSDRDFSLELMSTLSILMMHLSRFSEEIIFWCSWEAKFIELDDAYATGSSIMPQKKNPDIAELVRGKTGRVYGDLFALFTVMKALPLAYNKDMQEDKEPVFDAVDTVKNCLPVFAAMIESIQVNKERMKKACADGFLNATDCADYLVKKGLAFRDAYTVVGKLVNDCIAKNKSLESLSLEELQAHCPLFEADIFHAIALETCVAERKVPGGPAKESVNLQIASIQLFLSAMQTKE